MLVNLKIREWTKLVPPPVVGPGGKMKYPHALGERGYIEGMTGVTDDELRAAGFTLSDAVGAVGAVATNGVEPDKARVVASRSGRVVPEIHPKTAATTSDSPDGDRVGVRRTSQGVVKS